MTVTDREGHVVDTWTSGNTSHKIKNLVENQTYTLHEETATDGYVKASDITFTVKGVNEKDVKENQHIEMIDKRVEVSPAQNILLCLRPNSALVAGILQRCRFV